MDLIESGMKLFAAKGYHKTSIEEIAAKAGISKGAFYLYFDSKEDFIATALQYFHTQLTKRIADVSLEDLPPKQSLAHQINVITNYIYQHRNFIIIHLREDISIGKHAEELFQQMKIDHYHWLKENVQVIYGNKIEKYLLDIIIQLDGLLKGYFQWIIIDDLHVEKNRIGPYIVKRLDEIVWGMIEKNEEPLIPLANLPIEYQSIVTEQKNKEMVRNILFSIEEKIANMDIDVKKKQQLHEVTEIVLKKITKHERQNIMIQGLLAHFTSVSELKDECEKIAKILNIELLE